jgi:hypothetical protein
MKTFEEWINEHGDIVEREYNRICDEYGDLAPLLSAFKQQRYKEYMDAVKRDGIE